MLGNVPQAILLCRCQKSRQCNLWCPHKPWLAWVAQVAGSTFGTYRAALGLGAPRGICSYAIEFVFFRVCFRYVMMFSKPGRGGVHLWSRLIHTTLGPDMVRAREISNFRMAGSSKVAAELNVLCSLA